MNTARIKTVGRALAIWVPTVLLMLIFLPQGWSKFSDTSGWAVAFRVWGYPTWFRITIGVLETLGALSLLWGRTAMLGAALIIAIMLGGTGTHIVKEHGRHVTSEIVPITLATVVLVMRWRARRRERTVAVRSASPQVAA